MRWEPLGEVCRGKGAPQCRAALRAAARGHRGDYARGHRVGAQTGERVGDGLGVPGPPQSAVDRRRRDGGEKCREVEADHDGGACVVGCAGQGASAGHESVRGRMRREQPDQVVQKRALQGAQATAGDFEQPGVRPARTSHSDR